MNRREILELQSVREYPSLSIMAPMHRTGAPQDPIRVRNLVTEATAWLLDEFPRREVEPLLERLDYLVEDTDWHGTLDGLALFVNRDFAARLDLPFKVTERVLVDESFATRDLLVALNRSPRYWALSLGEHQARLLQGVRDTLQESSCGVIPPQSGEENMIEFVCRVDEELSRILKEEPLPVMVLGEKSRLALYDQLSVNTRHIAGFIEGGRQHTSLHDLQQFLWPAMQAYFSVRSARQLERLERAVAANKVASGISNIWQLAKEGRGDTLLVEEDFRFTNQCCAGAGGLTCDVVDSVIETVLDKGGQVVPVPNATLEKYWRIALILR